MYVICMYVLRLSGYWLLQKLIPHDCIRAVHGHFNVIETRMSMREMVVVHVTRQRADCDRHEGTQVTYYQQGINLFLYYRLSIDIYLL